MTLSVIIPVYKAQDTLDRCVESIICQSIPDMEIILVDDGSPDNCPAMCDAWAEKDSRIQVIHKQNGGLSDARNKALGNAKGDYFTFVDSDDYIAPDTYKHCLEQLQSNELIDILEYPILVHMGGGKREHMLCFNADIVSCETLQEQQECWIEKGLFSHSFMCNKLFHRDLFNSIRFPKNKSYEDVLTLPLLLKTAKCYATTGKGMYYYVDNSEGICMIGLKSNHESLIRAQLAALECLELDVNDHKTDKCMASLLNTQIDVWRFSETTPDAPLLPQRAIRYSAATSIAMKVKIFIHNTFGIRFLCNIFRFFSRIQ